MKKKTLLVSALLVCSLFFLTACSKASLTNTAGNQNGNPSGTPPTDNGGTPPQDGGTPPNGASSGAQGETPSAPIQ